MLIICDVRKINPKYSRLYLAREKFYPRIKLIIKNIGMCLVYNGSKTIGNSIFAQVFVLKNVCMFTCVRVYTMHVFDA